MKAFFKEFKEFAVKGNMMDMAIGVVIGTAFNKIIDVLAKEVLLPPLSLLSKSVNLQNKKVVLREAISDASGAITSAEVAINYGKLIEAFIDFFIIGFTLFVVLKFMNRLKRKAQDTKDTSVETPKDIELLSKLSVLMEEQNAILKSKSK